MTEHEIIRAAEAIASAEALLIGAGAGLSVDAGVPSYRLNPPGADGEPPPPLGALVPMLFTVSPELGWGRAGAQLALFRRAAPHRGYQLLRRWAERVGEAFVLTSNIDGMFLAAGFPEDRIVEGHGSMHFFQCTTPCSERVWSGEGYTPDLEERTGCARPPLPRCPDCGGPARPNVFMFGDSHFNQGRSEAQARAFAAWLRSIERRRLAVIECGAGTAVPTIRRKCEQLAGEHRATLIRINLSEPRAPDAAISLALPALEALERLEATGLIR